MKKRSRKKLFVDYQVQGTILARIAFYWFICVLFMTLAVLLVQTLSAPDRPFWVHIGPMCERYWPVYLAMVAVMPFVCYDALKLSNRFCGPLSRVVVQLEKFNSCGEFDGLSFREEDFWQPLAQSVSVLVERTQKSEAQCQ